jgi:predicted nucleic acid-binding protein
MIVVSDTGPLNYLTIIGHLDQLPALYGQVVIPIAVANELARPESPPLTSAIIQSPPSWLKILPVHEIDATLFDLGIGEQEAITLALSLSADLLLCDDYDARESAKRKNLRVVGTLGVLQEASTVGHLNMVEALTKLRTTNFRMSSALLDDLLKRFQNPA